MSDTITLTGVVATEPRTITTAEGLAITSFRLASTQRRFDRTSQKWVDGDTNWYTITSFRQLATNASASVKKGERVVVTGRLRIRDWESGERAGTNIEVEAEALGHDLMWGTAAFSRSISSAPVDRLQDEAGLEAGQAAAASVSESSTDVAALSQGSEEEPAPASGELLSASAKVVAPF